MSVIITLLCYSFFGVESESWKYLLVHFLLKVEEFVIVGSTCLFLMKDRPKGVASGVANSTNVELEASGSQGSQDPKL